MRPARGRWVPRRRGAAELAVAVLVGEVVTECGGVGRNFIERRSLGCLSLSETASCSLRQDSRAASADGKGDDRPGGRWARPACCFRPELAPIMHIMSSSGFGNRFRRSCWRLPRTPAGVPRLTPSDPGPASHLVSAHRRSSAGRTSARAWLLGLASVIY
jgi:hypothetical protein